LRDGDFHKNETVNLLKERERYLVNLLRDNWWFLLE